MKDCVHTAPFIGAREGELTAEERASLERHLAGCADCRAREADARALGPLLRDALMAEANHRDFAPFVDAVMERVARSPVHPESFDSAASRLRSGQAVPTDDSPLVAWLRRRRVAFAALVPALAAVALLVYVQRRPGPTEVASLMELTSEGEVTMVLQTSDGPLVLLGEERS